MKNYLFYSLLILTINGCVTSNVLVERQVTIVNNSRLDLSDVTIQTSWVHNHDTANNSDSNKILIDYISSGEEVKTTFFGRFNSECVSLYCESLYIPIKDCMKEEIITTDTFKIIINNNSISTEI